MSWCSEIGVRCFAAFFPTAGSTEFLRIYILGVINNMKEISWNDFVQVELRIGEIVGVKDFPEARKPAYQLQIDFGDEIGRKKSSAQITELYGKKELLGKKVVAVVNFPDKQIGPFMSECLVTGFHREGGSVVLCIPDKDIHNGAKLA